MTSVSHLTPHRSLPLLFCWIWEFFQSFPPISPPPNTRQVKCPTHLQFSIQIQIAHLPLLPPLYILPSSPSFPPSSSPPLTSESIFLTQQQRLWCSFDIHIPTLLPNVIRPFHLLPLLLLLLLPPIPPSSSSSSSSFSSMLPHFFTCSTFILPFLEPPSIVHMQLSKYWILLHTHSEMVYSHFIANCSTDGEKMVEGYIYIYIYIYGEVTDGRIFALDMELSSFHWFVISFHFWRCILLHNSFRDGILFTLHSVEFSIFYPLLLYVTLHPLWKEYLLITISATNIPPHLPWRSYSSAPEWEFISNQIWILPHYNY